MIWMLVILLFMPPMAMSNPLDPFFETFQQLQPKPGPSDVQGQTPLSKGSRVINVREV